VSHNREMSQKWKGVIMKKAALVHESSSERGNHNNTPLLESRILDLMILFMNYVCIRACDGSLHV
jgi:hypothetical protein